jgi:oligopeptide transport system substrate-binding protein
MSGSKNKLLGVIAAVVAFAGCTRQEPPHSAPTQILRISQRNEPSDLDPATATLPDEFFIIRALSEGLLIPDPAGGAPLPAAAESFDVSPDVLTYTFHLRPDARWSNSEPVTAADFVDSYRRLLTPATAAPKANLFFAVKNSRAFATGALADFSAVGLRATDPHTLVITLDRPTPRFPYYVASGPWIPVNPRVVAQYGRSWTAPGHFVGNGPFSLAEWRQQQRIVVEKNPRFRLAGRVRLEEIQFLRFDDGDAEERAYRAGQLDVTMSVPTTKLATYARERPAELHRAPLAETRYLAFNTQRAPLNDERVRRALVQAIDRQKVVDRVLLGGQVPTYFFLPPQIPFDPNGLQLEPFGFIPFEPAAARKALAEAGFSEGRNFPRLELTGWAQTPVLEAVQEMWRQSLGIEVNLLVRDAKVHLATLREGQYDIAFITEIPDVADASAVLANFVSGASNNYSHWSDPAYDQLFTRLEATSDSNKRASLQANAVQRLAVAVPVAPLYFNTHNWLMSPRVHGWQEDALWTRCYLNVYLDEK